jgi:short-subunit dehydrogenase
MSAPWNTALVTGASTGIGAAFARALAGQGVDLVITARDTARLKALATELQDRNGVAVQVLTADLAKRPGVAKVAARLAQPADGQEPIDLLVNNAGFGSTGVFWQLPVDTEEAEVLVNVVAPLRLAHAALGPMVERGSGTVLNVSSIAGEQSVPNNATYGGTKAFVTTWSQSLHEEAKPHGVAVTALLPGFTRTEFQDRAGYDDGRKLPSFAWMEADEVVAEALAGAEAGRAVIVPGLGNKVVTAASSVVPRGVKRRVLSFVQSKL